MYIKIFLGKIVEKLTGRRCANCRYNCKGHCTRSKKGYMKCWHSITKPGFDKRRPRYLSPESAALTAQERHELQKIKATLQEAGETARESGLLED